MGINDGVFVYYPLAETQLRGNLGGLMKLTRCPEQMRERE